ncbi:hypothetical protein Hokovirus_4_9 [Hokovirus HKV1]|uniref:Uncharacterized protein n=1 Tax=Hokovirus HKV1 TaxID=1977638 RepID=A0A1V0SH34_9VIRU|nr:hypothetical protein Hokovirus_4_9 [Hokovirus HKV1]
MTFIRFITTGYSRRPDGTETVLHRDNHTGHNPSERDIEFIIQCYKEQVAAMNSKKFHIDRGYQLEFVTSITIIAGHEYLQ